MKTKNCIDTAMILAMTGATILGDSPVAGQVTAYNSSTSYGGSLAQEITGYIAGLPASNEEDLLDRLFPAVQANDFFEYLKADDEFFLTEADDSDIRTIGASFKRIEHRGTTVVDKCAQKGLTMRVDHKSLIKSNGKIVPGWENQKAADLKNRLIRAEIVRGLALLDAAATNAAKTWDATTNPDGDLRGMVQLTRKAKGMLPTHLLIGSDAWQLRQDAYEAAARANHAMANHASYTEEELARYTRAGQVIVEDGITQAAKDATKTDRLGLVAYSYSAQAGAGLFDPSNIKRAYANTDLSGGRWAVHIQPGVVFTDITVFHESKIFVPFTQGIRKITASA